jgi:UDP-N-acetylmuramoyl-L-alanyl-D-glutamate--2,6-diaminopimelate ligase
MGGMKRLSQLIAPEESLGSKLEPDVSVRGISADSRECLAGKLFFAIRGAKTDGNDYLSAALEKGVSGLVVERPELAEAFPRTILVPSVRSALARSASRWFDEPSRQFDVVAVTGTNGKTTSTFLLKQIWDQFGLKTGLIGTVDCYLGTEAISSRLTTPDAISLQSMFRKMVDAGVTHAAVEVTSIALDQDRVTNSRFQAAIFSNLTQDHLDYHQDFEAYYQAKLALFTKYEIPLGVFNIDCPWGERMARESKVERAIGFSTRGAKNALYVARDIQLEKGETKAVVSTPAGEFILRTPLIGEHNIYNILGVVATLAESGVETDKIFRALPQATGAPGRLERVAPSENRPYVFVDYAHTPDALENVLRSLRKLRERSGKGKILTVFGCGGDRDRAKRPMMGRIAFDLSDVAVATSDNPRTEPPEKIIDDIAKGLESVPSNFYKESNRRAAIHLALSMASPDDLVLVAGKGHETYQIIGVERIPFDDRDVIRDYYS